MAAEDGLMTTLPDVSVASRPSDGGNPLAPYFPRLVIDWIMTTPGDRYREVESTVAFVDISGFTKLSEGLARHGKVGAEELTATINTCFIAQQKVISYCWNVGNRSYPLYSRTKQLR